MKRKAVTTTSAPAAIGPYSQAIRANDFLFISGQIPLNPESGQLAGTEIDSQTRQVLLNIKSLLEAENLGLADVVKVSIFMTDFSLFTRMNEIYGSFFTNDQPARETIGVAALPRNALIEISAIAAYPADKKESNL